MKELTEKDKKRIIWLRTLLKEKAPIVYQKYVAYKKQQASDMEYNKSLFTNQEK